MIVKNSWNDITVEEWLELELSKKNNSYWDYQTTKLSILCEIDKDDEYFDDLDIDDITDLINKSKFLDTPPNKNWDKVIDKYHFIDLNKITVGEWIDLDNFLMKDMLGNFTKILSILWRQKSTDKWGNIEWEPYTYNINLRSREFEFIKIGSVYGVIEYILSWREKILENYKAILTSDDGDKLDETEKEGLTEADIVEIEADLKKERAKLDFSWLKFVWDLSGEDITKMKDVLSTGFILTMNTQMMLQVYK